jgi:hypothetical protein
MLEMQKVITFDLGIARVDVDDELAAKSFKLKVRMNGVTHMKTDTAKVVQFGKDGSQIQFDTFGSTIYEGGKVLDFELCQTHFSASSRTVASGHLKLKTILQNMDRKAWSLELLSVTNPGKVLATFELQLDCRSTLLRSAGGTKALKTMQVPTPPEHFRSGLVFGFKANAQEVSVFVKKAVQAHARLEAAFQYAEKMAVSKTDSSCLHQTKSARDRKSGVIAKNTGQVHERLETIFHNAGKTVVSETDSDCLLHESRNAIDVMEIV